MPYYWIIDDKIDTLTIIIIIINSFNIERVLLVFTFYQTGPSLGMNKYQ